MRKSLFIYLAFSMFLFGACGGGGGGGNEGTDGSPGKFKDAAAGDAGANKVDGATTKSKKCGDKVVDTGEECDDGNTVDNDGCNSMCEYTCEKDADCPQTDPCNSGETCDTAKHICNPGTVKKADGETCRDNATCYQGKCYDIACGNGVVQKDEECDDGDTDDFNGCTKDCKFTCVSGDETRNCVNSCDLESSCDDTTHTCTAGSPLPDGTLCLQGNGYCKDGQCIPSNCGDGVQEPNEECDLGSQNGGADCSATCTKFVCGNGQLEGDEQCDDGNNENNDGCNSKCRAEVVFRLTRLAILTEDAPSYCTYAGNANKGNAFRNMFPAGSTAMLDTMTSLMNGMFSDGGVNILLHIMDLENPAADKPDPLISIGITQGELAAGTDWANTTDKLDFPITVDKPFIDADGKPLMVLLGELADKGGGTMEIRSTKPGTAGFTEPGGAMDFTLYGAMSALEVDPARSQPPTPPPPEFAADLKMPETLGRDADTAPQGRLCGAMKTESFASIGLPTALTVLCGVFTYRPCDFGGVWTEPSTGNCDSVLTLLQKGCGAILSPIGDPDADINGDGTNEAYSVVVGHSTRRIKVVGITPAADGGVDAGP